MSYLTPSTGEILVNTTTLNQQDDPRIAALPNGGFVVVWESADAGDTRNDVFQQIYDASGAPVGGNTRINTDTSISHSNPKVEVLNDGSWVVSWSTWDSTSGEGDVMIRSVASDGTPSSPATLLNTVTSGYQGEVEITSLKDGGYVAVWYGENADSDGYGIRAQRFDANGQAVGVEYTVNTDTAGDQLFPKATTLNKGDVMISWQSYVYVWSR